MQQRFTVSYGEGWHAPEQDAEGSLRWTGGRACLTVEAAAPCRSAWLRLGCGTWGAVASPPLLVASVDGRDAGASAVSAHLGYVSFPLGGGDRFQIELRPDRTFAPPSDDRVLGVMVRGVEVFDEDALTGPLELDGWHRREEYEYFPFNWMEREARVLVPGLAAAGPRFVTLPICPGLDEGQVLEIRREGERAAELRLLRGWHLYDVAIGEDADAGNASVPRPLLLTLRANTLVIADAHTGDPRPMSVRVGPIEAHRDRRRHGVIGSFHRPPADAAQRGARAAADSPARPGEVCCGTPAEGDGWHLEERDEGGPFRWMKREARVRLRSSVRGGRRFCSLPVFTAFRNLAQELTVTAGGEVLARLALPKGWHTYSLALPPDAGEDLDLALAVNRLTPASAHPGDPRELGVRVGWITLHDDEGRHRRETFVAENARRNQREMSDGVVEVRSFPQTLGIDLYGQCNIKPACVYCLWDPMKALEGNDVDAVVDDRTLQAYGGPFDAARLLVNCSFGEPLLHPRLDKVLDLAASTGKLLELSTNGQAFTPRTVGLLAGRRVHLYVSLDAATAATYARLRNDRWDEVLAGLLFLRDAREAGGGWPRLNMVFMPMPANVADLERYFQLCRLVEADSLVLRPLLHLGQPDMVRERGGYRFDYGRELMPREALEPVFAACERHAAAYGVPVVSQFDFGLGEAARFRRAEGAKEGA